MYFLMHVDINEKMELGESVHCRIIWRARCSINYIIILECRKFVTESIDAIDVFHTDAAIPWHLSISGSSIK